MSASTNMSGCFKNTKVLAHRNQCRNAEQRLRKLWRMVSTRFDELQVGERSCEQLRRLQIVKRHGQPGEEHGKQTF